MAKCKVINSRYLLVEQDNKTYIVETISDSRERLLGGFKYLNFKGKAALVDESDLEYVTKMARNTNIVPWAGILGIMGMRIFNELDTINIFLNRWQIGCLFIVLLFLTVLFIQNEYSKKFDERFEFNRRVIIKSSDRSFRNYRLCIFAVLGILLIGLWVYIQVLFVNSGSVRIANWVKQSILPFLGAYMFQAVNYKKLEVEILDKKTNV